MLSKMRQIEMAEHFKKLSKKREWEMSTRKWVLDKIKRFLYKKVICPNCKYKMTCLIKDEFKTKPFCGMLQGYLLAFYLVILPVILALFGRPYGLIPFLFLVIASGFHLWLARKSRVHFHTMIGLEEEHKILDRHLTHLKSHMGVSQHPPKPPPPPPPPPPIRKGP